MTMKDIPSGITGFHDFVHVKKIYKLKAPVTKRYILKFIIKKSNNYSVR